MTPFERGLRDGCWTLEEVYGCGFHSVQECLEYQEQAHQQDLADLAHLPPELAARHAQYLKGLITATRASLRALLWVDGERR